MIKNIVCIISIYFYMKSFLQENKYKCGSYPFYTKKISKMRDLKFE